MEQYPALGTHILLDCFEVQSGSLNDPGELVSMLERAATQANATILASHQHRFEPHGVSALCILAESHISIHTWPEQRCATVDIYTCGDTAKPTAAAELILFELSPRRHQLVTIDRGSART
ncbi:MAG: adenosylmethionine decarboxylase [Acidimicrobiia bacterium]